MGKVIALAAVKGGTGKTATAGALAFAAKRAKKKVLCIDLDIQTTLSSWLRADPERPNSYDVISGNVAAADAIQTTAVGIDVIQASENLVKITASKDGSARRLEEAIKGIRRQYDLVLIDTSPNMGELQNNAIYAASGILIPLCTDTSSLQAFYKIVDVVNVLRAGKPSIKIYGIVFTQYDARSNFNRFMYDGITSKAKEIGIPLLGSIRQGIAVRESIGTKSDIYQRAPKSNPAADYIALYKKIMEVQ